MRQFAGAARIALAAVSSVCILGAAVARADGPPIRIRATIETVAADSLTVKTGGGQIVEVKLTDKTGVTAVSHAQLADIAPDSYVGIAALPADGKLRALEVTVFPPSMRGAGDGHYPWDLGETSTMTNGAVGSVSGTSGRMLTVQYKGGEKDIVVPPDVPIVKLAPGDRALLKTGAHVVVFAPPSYGPATALFILAGEGDVVPPM